MTGRTDEDVGNLVCGGGGGGGGNIQGRR